MDTMSKLIVNAIKAKPGMWENTLVVFSSDNGGPIFVTEGANNYPMRGSKEADFEGGVRVASFVSGGYLPSSQRGKVSDALISFADWYVTFAMLGGATKRQATHDPNALKYNLPDIDGVNQWPVLSGRTTGSVRTLLHLSPQALISGNYKLITGSTGNTNYWCPRVYPFTSDFGRPLHMNPYGLEGYYAQYSMLQTVTELLNKAINVAFQYDCGQGCLFDTVNDPSELYDLAAQNPVILKSMINELASANKTLFTPNRGTLNVTYCSIMYDHYGPFYGPYVGF
jgi:arylsulfatase A-like enzyme